MLCHLAPGEMVVFLLRNDFIFFWGGNSFLKAAEKTVGLPVSKKKWREFLAFFLANLSLGRQAVCGKPSLAPSSINLCLIASLLSCLYLERLKTQLGVSEKRRGCRLLGIEVRHQNGF